MKLAHQSGITSERRSRRSGERWMDHKIVALFPKLFTHGYARCRSISFPYHQQVWRGAFSGSFCRTGGGKRLKLRSRTRPMQRLPANTMPLEAMPKTSNILAAMMTLSTQTPAPQTGALLWPDTPRKPVACSRARKTMARCMLQGLGKHETSTRNARDWYELDPRDFLAADKQAQDTELDRGNLAFPSRSPGVSFRDRSDCGLGRLLKCDRIS